MWKFYLEYFSPVIGNHEGLQIFKKGVEYVKWVRVNQYLKSFDTSVEKGDFIPESAVYKLAFKSSNTRRLDRDEVMASKLEGMNMVSTLINESGLYSAILGSNKEEAKRFKKWVTSEVTELAFLLSVK